MIQLALTSKSLDLRQIQKTEMYQITPYCQPCVSLPLSLTLIGNPVECWRRQVAKTVTPHNFLGAASVNTCFSEQRI